jgi:hypothetical protein
MFQTPTWFDVADLPYSKDITAAIEEANRANDAWAEAESALAIAQQSLDTAESDWAEKLTKAARDGGTYPGARDLSAFEGGVIFAEQIVSARLADTNRAIDNLHQLIEANRLTVAALAVEKAEAGLAAYAEALERHTAEHDLIERARIEALDGVTMMGNNFGGNRTNLTVNLWRGPHHLDNDHTAAITALKRMVADSTPTSENPYPDYTNDALALSLGGKRGATTVTLDDGSSITLMGGPKSPQAQPDNSENEPEPKAKARAVSV